ncbi:MAG: malate dehydrogenase (quinone) [Chitinophagales bacterium]|jgi:malate dehydrogenase (quinone)|nr:malate dehydrogenase (quinone) [Chitinophagales bacterium]
MKPQEHQHIVLIGAGIMSATLGVLLKELLPNCTIDIFERLDRVGAESSDAWNNAGTGHAAYCELNYTPQLPDGSVNIDKAIKIGNSFEESKQFWAYLVERLYVPEAADFIHRIPHISFVWGEENKAFLRKRFEQLQTIPLFADMLYTENPATVRSWVPLIMDGRTDDEPIAATRMDIGTDVNFGSLTRSMITYLDSLEGVNVYLGYEVRDLQQSSDTKSWNVRVKHLDTGEKKHIVAEFVFIGAGGGAMPLLEKSDIPEAKGYGGFPISGQWLRCTNESIIAQHHAKVYGKAAVNAPPMSVPHLDTRVINGKKELLFGPYAGFTTKFLKNGSYFDLPLSIELSNIYPMLAAGVHNIPLTKYLIEQVVQSHEDRVDSLKAYLPTAKAEEWELLVAGQRVQIIKKNETEGGVLEFGTEIVATADGTLAALLGASPGASTGVSIMLNLLQKCFPIAMESEEWLQKIKAIIPTFGQSLAYNSELCTQTRARTHRILEL